MYDRPTAARRGHCGFFRGVFGDFRTMWWDEQNPQRIMVGSDGGVNVSYDGGRTAILPQQAARRDLRRRRGHGRSRTTSTPACRTTIPGRARAIDRSGMITLEHWTTVGPATACTTRSIRPTRAGSTTRFQTVGQRRFAVDGPGGRTIEPSASRQRAALRYNWVTPIVLSPHNPQIVYTGAQVLFGSLNRGDAWQDESDLTTGDERGAGCNSRYVPYRTITSISESPLTAGADPHRTPTDRQGARHAAITGRRGTGRDRRGGGRGDEPAGTRAVYLRRRTTRARCSWRSGFRNDDFRPLCIRTKDFGKTWTSISSNLVASPINIVVQDRENANLLISEPSGRWVAHRRRGNWTVSRRSCRPMPDTT